MKREDFNQGKSRNEQLDLTPLFNYQLEGITASVIFDLRRPKDNNNFPVKYRVTYKQRQVYYPCTNMTAELYDTLHGDVRKREYIKAKTTIFEGFERITDTIKVLSKEGAFSLEGLAKRLSKGTADSIYAAFDNRILELDNNGKVGSMVWYTSAKNSIKKYTKKADLKFSDITPDWLKKYEKEMRDDDKQYTTISINMRALRAVMNTGLREGVITPAQYPFAANKNGKYKIPEGEGRKIALSEAQLYDVIDYSLNPDEEIYRDLWLFSFYASGANMGDICRLKYSDIQGNCIEWFRGKTVDTDKKKIKIRALITEEMQDIIDLYGNKDKSGYIFPYITAGLTPMQERMIIQNLIHCINNRMKQIGKSLGYGDITTYWARHSFASISRRKNVSLFAISKSMGHKSLATTEIYLDSLSDDELIKNAAKLPRRTKR